LPKDLLEQLNKLIDAEIKPAEPSALSDLLGKLEAAEAAETPRQQRLAKREAKRAELREGGRKAHEQDWVSQRTPTPIVADTLGPQKPKQAPTPRPVPLTERPVEDLYKVLLERWRRYAKVVAEDMPDRKVALSNATEIAVLLEQRGETSEQIVAFIKAETE